MERWRGDAVPLSVLLGAQERAKMAVLCGIGRRPIGLRRKVRVKWGRRGYRGLGVLLQLTASIE